MKRLLPIFTLALLGLSACDSGTLVSPLEPEVGEPSFAKAARPGIEPTVHYSTPEPCSFPETLIRAPGAPARVVCEFTGEEGAEMTLVVEVSHPEITTVKAWLNGVMVLLPSADPLPDNENLFKVALDVVPGANVLDVRLSGKPGEENWVSVSVESEVVAPTDGGGIEPPPETFPFALTPAAGPSEDRATACAALGAYVAADWNDVGEESQHWEELSALLSSGMAWIRSNEATSYQGWGSMGLTDFYYLITGSEALGGLYGTSPGIGPDLLWLGDASLDELDQMGQSGQQPVLCIATP